VHDVRVRSITISSSTWTLPIAADCAQVVAREVDQHHVLGALFRIGEQFCRDAMVRGLVGPGTRTGERANAGGAAVEPDEKLREAPKTARRRLEKEHIRRWIARPDVAIEVERRAGDHAREADADLELIGFAVANELLRLRDPGENVASSIDASIGRRRDGPRTVAR